MNQAAIQVLPFSEKESEWRMWSRKIIARAMARGYKEVLEPQDPHIIASKEQNNNTYNNLILSINNKITFGIINEATSQDHPTGDAKVAWKELKAKYKLKTG